MLDKRSGELLYEINKLCSVGSFVAIERQDLVSDFSSRFSFDKDNLKQCLHFLQREGYIEIKYQDEDIVCLSPLPKGRREYETHIEEKQKARTKTKFVVLLVFAFAFMQIITSFMSLIIYNLIF